MSWIEVSRCNVCQSDDNSTVCHFPVFPLIAYPLSNDLKERINSKKIPTSMPLLVAICRNCSHIFLRLRPDEGILQELYENLYVNYPSPLQLGFATSEADEFVKLFRQYLKPRLSPGAKILEIGCYDGYVLSQLKEDFKVLGCDPSDGAKLGQREGIPIINAFYSPSLFEPNDFDVVICRHLIEHIGDPVDFMGSIAKVVKASGYVVIETPNAAHSLKYGSPENLHSEHLSAFTPISLETLCSRAGFRVERLWRNRKDLLMICKPGASKESLPKERDEIEKLLEQAAAFASRLQGYLAEISALAEKLARQGATIAVWGAGSFGTLILTLVPSLRDRIVAIVDRDPQKHGLSSLTVDVPVSPPEYLQAQPVDYIFICSQFGSEILRDIRNKYELRAKVVLLLPKIEVVS